LAQLSGMLGQFGAHRQHLALNLGFAPAWAAWAWALSTWATRM
jgi:hypothetical protein